jgi:hypothetical protein
LRRWSHEQEIKSSSPEVRERAVRMVQEHRGEHQSVWAAIESIAPKIGCVPQTLNEWVRKQEIDTGLRDGVTSVYCSWKLSHWGADNNLDYLEVVHVLNVYIAMQPVGVCEECRRNV